MNFVYGCVFWMCLSGGFCSKAILSRSVVVQSGFVICISRWLHVFRLGLIVVISAYSIRGGGCCWFWYMYFERCGYLVVASWCFGCVKFMLGENSFAKCWYYGCNLIVLGMKYILDLNLCGGGCVWSRFGMGPGFASMSPHNISRRCVFNVFLYVAFCL